MFNCCTSRHADLFLTFSVCSIDADKFKPLYRGSPVVTCPYCSSNYSPSFKGQLCKLCDLSSVS